MRRQTPHAAQATMKTARVSQERRNQGRRVLNQEVMKKKVWVLERARVAHRAKDDDNDVGAVGRVNTDALSSAAVAAILSAPAAK